MRDENTLQLENLFKRNTDIIFSGFSDEDQNFTPMHVWKHVVCIGSRPTLTFSQQCIVDASKCWWNLAQSFRLLSNSESKVSCLISIGGLGSLPWALIEFPVKNSFFQYFTINEGYPEFIITNKSSNIFLAITSEEDEIWIYLVKRDESGFSTL